MDTKPANDNDHKNTPASARKSRKTDGIKSNTIKTVKPLKTDIAASICNVSKISLDANKTSGTARKLKPLEIRSPYLKQKSKLLQNTVTKKVLSPMKVKSKLGVNQRKSFIQINGKTDIMKSIRDSSNYTISKNVNKRLSLGPGLLGDRKALRSSTNLTLTDISGNPAKISQITKEKTFINKTDKIHQKQTLKTVLPLSVASTPTSKNAVEIDRCTKNHAESHACIENRSAKKEPRKFRTAHTGVPLPLNVRKLLDGFKC